MCKKQTSVSHSSTESEIIWGWMVFPLLIYGIWSLQFLETRIRTGKNGETRCWTNVKFVRSLHTIHKRKESQRVINDLDNVDFIHSNVYSSHQEALLYVFEDNEEAIKKIIKGRSPTLRHVSRTHRVALDWLFDRINLDPKSQIKYIDTKNQFADILTKGNFPRDEWNHLLCLSNISHFSSTDCAEVMSKRTKKRFRWRKSQQNRSRWWIWSRDGAKGLLMCCLPLHQKARGKPDMKVNFFLRPQTEQRDRTGRLVVFAYSSSYSEWNVDKTWSSQEWESDELMGDGTGRPVVTAQHTDRFIADNDKMNSYTEAELEMSLESRSLLHRVNDQVRKRQNQSSKDATKDSDKHSVIWWMFMSATLEASVFMGKELLRQFAFHQKYWRSHNETYVRHIWEIDNRTMRRDLWNKYN